VNGGNKRTISRFGIYAVASTGAYSERALERKKRTVVIDVYECDYGQANVKLDRMIGGGEVFGLETADFRIAWLRPTHIVNPANLGDYEKRVVLSEFTLEIRAEEHSFRMYGITGY